MLRIVGTALPHPIYINANPSLFAFLNASKFVPCFEDLYSSQPQSLNMRILGLSTSPHTLQTGRFRQLIVS